MNKFMGEEGDVVFPEGEGGPSPDAKTGALLELADKLARKEISQEEYAAAVKKLGEAKP